MLSDLESFSRLKELYPDRVFQIKYKDIASQPIVRTQGLYMQLGKSRNSYMKSIIQKISNLDPYNPASKLNFIFFFLEFKIDFCSRL